MKILEGRPVPLFPLPSVVIFPRIVQPLYVFEPRYRSMLADVLDSYGAIAMAHLKPGYEGDYYGSPPVHPVVSLGNLVTYQTREDGSSDIILLGECRARIVEEVTGKEYRRATLVKLREREPHSLKEKAELREKLESWLSRATSALARKEALARLQKCFSRESDLGFLVDFLACHFLEEPDAQQRVLEELDVARRARYLLEHLAV